MDFQIVVNELSGAVRTTPLARPEAKPQWLARRAAYLRLNAIHSGAVRCPHCGVRTREAVHRRRRSGLFGLRRGRV